MENLCEKFILRLIKIVNDETQKICIYPKTNTAQALEKSINISKFTPYIKSLVRELSSNGYIKTDVLGTDFMRFSLTSKAFSVKAQHRNDCIKFWLPIVVSNVIALAALVISIVK